MDNVQSSGLQINFKVKFNVIDSVYGLGLNIIIMFDVSC
jgi:hypothetical protein